MTIQRSTNCAVYTDTVSTLVEITATVPGGGSKCKVNIPAFSCQTKAFENPDADTAVMLTTKAAEELLERGCDASKMQVNFATNLMGARDMEYSAKKLAKGGMASNCFLAGNDPNHATHKVTARCHPMFDMLDADGNTVRNYNMTFNSELAACDVSDEAMPQLMEDARKVAAYNASTNGYTVEKPEHLACDYGILPHI